MLMSKAKAKGRPLPPLPMEWKDIRIPAATALHKQTGLRGFVWPFENLAVVLKPTVGGDGVSLKKGDCLFSWCMKTPSERKEHREANQAVGGNDNTANKDDYCDECTTPPRCCM